MVEEQLCGFCGTAVAKSQMSKHYEEKHSLNPQQQKKLKQIIGKAKNAK